MSTLRHEQFIDHRQTAIRTSGSDRPAARLARNGSFARRAIAADAAGFAVADRDGRLRTVGETDRLVITVDAMQSQLHEGPGIDLTSGATVGVVQSDDLLTEQRWPRWAPLVAQLGFRSLLAIPVSNGAGQQATFTVYARQLRRFTADDLASIRYFTAEAAEALAEFARTGRPIGLRPAS